MKKKIIVFTAILLFSMLSLLVGHVISHDKVVVIPLTREKSIEPFAAVQVATEIPDSVYKTGIFAFSIIDQVTGLEWQRIDDNISRSWESAILYCAYLNIGDYVDWRLPSVAELQSIVDYREDFPAINSTAFPNTNQERYWSSTKNIYQNNRSYAVNFEDGSILSGSNSQEYLVRCVRRGQSYNSNGPYQVNDDETVTDLSTGLVWQRGSQGSVTYNQAVSYCNQLPLAGAGWRLPNVKELLSLRDDRLQRLMIDTTAFPESSLNYHWTSNSYLLDGGDAWVVQFLSGSGLNSPGGLVVPNDKSIVRHARCVR